MIANENAQDLIGTTVYGSDGDKIGKISKVYFDDGTGALAWATVQTGFLGTRENFIPVSDATLSGDRVTVPFDKARVKDAPNIDADGHLNPEEEAQLYRYYGVDYGTDGGGYETDVDTTTRTGDDDTTRTDTDDAMTLSEERLNVGTERRETGRVRLRKYVVTENVTRTVPVTREEVRLEREPIDSSNLGHAYSGPELTESEHEVVLHEETPVIDKETVPTERVRLAKETVTDQASVTEDVRKERIETDGDEHLR